MMSQHPGEPVVGFFFEFMKEGQRQIAAEFVDDPDAIIDEARTRLDEMLTDLAYIDNPGHPMAAALFMCQINLAVYLSLAERGVDVHAYGSRFLAHLAEIDLPMTDGMEA